MFLTAVVWTPPASAAAPEPPEVTVVSPVLATTATLDGVLNPKGANGGGTYEFLYKAGTECEGGGHAPSSPGLSLGGEHEEFTEVLTGLTPNTEYTVCLRAEDEFSKEATVGAPVSFKTALPPETPETTSPAKTVTATSALFEGVLNPNAAGNPGTYEFAYRESPTECQGAGEKIAASGAMSGAQAQAVEGEATELLPAATYTFCLRAINEAGETAVGPPVSFTTPAVNASVDAAAATNVTATSAEITAHINPNGADTTYVVEYGITPGYGKTIPEIATDIGSGRSDVSVSQTLTGLSANTEYHWRVVATNVAGTTDGVDHTLTYPISGEGPDTCPNVAFRQGASAGLPDCRAYELVSPAYTEGEPVKLVGVASDGSTLFARSIGAFAGTGSTAGGGQYRLGRTPFGWEATSIAPPASEFRVQNNLATSYADSSSDASRSLFDLPAPPGNAEYDFYMRNASGSFTDIGPITPPTAPSPGVESAPNQFVYSAASSDLSRVVYLIANGDFLWPFDSTDPTVVSATRPSLYEFAGTGSMQPILVGVSGPRGSTSLISQCGTILGAPTFSNYNAVSSDGSTIYFTAIHFAGCSAAQPPANELFARVDGDGPAAHTVAISEPSAVDCSSCQIGTPLDATFQGASADGSKVFFTTAQQLLPGDTDSDVDLYEYNFDAPGGQRVTLVSGGGVGDPTPGSGAQVQGVARISQDGSHVYFVAQGVLTTVANGVGAAAQAGQHNLYVYNTTNGQTAFVATLAPGDSSDWAEFDARPVQATPDGRYLLFLSRADLTPDDSSSAATQVFRYEALTGALQRISIGEDGFNNNGNANIAGLQATIPRVAYSDSSSGTVSALPQSMSADGTRIVFQTPVGLTSQALDDVPIDSSGHLAQNVYEWEQSGVGSCPAAQASGCVSLISDGQDLNTVGASALGFPGSAVHLYGTDASGSDVFFTTSDPLVPSDVDNGISLYDARSDGGFPPGQGTPSCTGDACQGPPAPAPGLPAAASATFSGPGNVPSGARTVKVKVLKKTVKGSKIVLTVRVPMTGRITITGKGVKTVRRLVSKAGSYPLTVTLTASETNALRHKRKLEIRLRVGYTPNGGAASVATVTVTVKA